MKNVITEGLKRIFTKKGYQRIRNIFYSIWDYVPRQRILTQTITFSQGGHPHLSYAGMVPQKEHVATGGKVKLITLNQSFPEQGQEINILYLISSCLPRHLSQWIRVCKKSGVKIVLNQNGVYYPGWFGEGWEEGNKELKLALESADYVFYQSEFAQRSADKFLGVTQASSCILHNAVDASLFAPAHKPKENNCFTLLMAGTCNDLYRFKAAVRTLALLKSKIADVRLLVAGKLSWAADKQIQKDTTAVLKNEGVLNEVEFMAPYTQRDAPRIYQRADVLLHPQSNDVCPTVVLEAMACGLPVVYPKNGGTPELVGPDAGVGVEANESWEKIDAPDPDALAEAVLTVASQRDVFSTAARERATKMFNSNLWIQKQRDVFRQLLDEN